MLHPPSRWSTLSFAGIGSGVALLGFCLGHFLPDGQRSNVAPSSSAEATRVETPPSAGQAKPATSSETARWDEQWKKLTAQSSTPARDRDLASLIEELAKKDPKRALDFASAQTNWDLRDNLRNAALRGWGSVAPDAAAAWAVDRRLEERMPSVDAVLTGAAKNPDEAVRVATKLCASDPVPAGDYGHAVISALIENGAFEAAARFAAGASMVDRQSLLLESSFRQWAQYQPDQALAALATVADPKARSAAYEGVISGWADADAHKLADYAQTLPAGENRSRALAAALPHWVEKDPAAAMEWIGRFDPSADLDDGMAAVAKLPSIATQHPETAMEWADSISDPAKRLMTKNEVFTSWVQTNPSAAKKFAATAKNPDEREMMLNLLNRGKPGG